MRGVWVRESRVLFFVQAGQWGEEGPLARPWQSGAPDRERARVMIPDYVPRARPLPAMMKQDNILY